MLKRNAVQCLKCSEVIESKHRHDFRYCKCGNVAVDGGLDYAKRCFATEEWKELAEADGVLTRMLTC